MGRAGGARPAVRPPATARACHDVALNEKHIRSDQRHMTNDDIAHLRLLADWHDRQARYLLLTVPAGQHDQGRFHSMAAARLSRFADEATMSRGND